MNAENSRVSLTFGPALTRWEARLVSQTLQGRERKRHEVWRCGCKADYYQMLLINHSLATPLVANPFGCSRLENLLDRCYWSNEIPVFLPDSAAAEWEILEQTASSESILPVSRDASPFPQLKSKHIKRMSVSLLGEGNTRRSNQYPEINNVG